MLNGEYNIPFLIPLVADVPNLLRLSIFGDIQVSLDIYFFTLHSDQILGLVHTESFYRFQNRGRLVGLYGFWVQTRSRRELTRIRRDRKMLGCVL